jgi:hypothetical protein
MAGPIASLFVKLGLDAREFTQGIDRAQTSVQGFTRDSGSRFSQFGANVKQGFGLAFGLSTVSLIRDGVNFVTGGINDSIDAFKQQEIATAKLTTSLEANVPGWQKYQGAIDAAMQSTISMGFQDDDFALGLSRVVAATHDVQKGLEVMAVAQDLARFKGISLTDAAEALTKVEAGRFRMLAELGIELPKNATEEQALAAVRKAAAGQAAAYTETLAGKEDVLNAKLNEQQEILGQKLAPAQLAVNELQIKLIESAGHLADGFDMSNKSASEQVGWLNSLHDDVAGLFPQLGGLADSLFGTATALKDTSDDTDFFARHITDATAAVGLLPDAAKAAADALKQNLGTSLAQGINIGRGSSLYANMVKQAYEIGQGIVPPLTQGLMDDASQLDQTMSNLRDIIKNGLSPDDLAAEAAGKKTIKLFRQGMNSENIGAKEDAELLAAQSIKALVDTAQNGALGGKSAQAAGKYLGGLFDAGLNSTQVDAMLSGAGLSKEAIQGIHDQFPQFFGVGAGAGGKVDAGFLSPNHQGAGSNAANDIRRGIASNPWHGWGWNVGSAWISGFKDKFEAFSWANLINSTIGPRYGGQSPPPEGPMHVIDKWGYNVGSAWVEGFGLAMSKVTGGETGLQMATARVASLGVSAPGLAVAAGRVGGITNNFYGPIYGGQAGLRQLDQDIRNATRQATRGANREVGR